MWQTFSVCQLFHNLLLFLILWTIKKAAADQKPPFPFCETVWGFASCFPLDAKMKPGGSGSFGCPAADPLSQAFFRAQPPSPLCLFVMQAASWPRGSVSITLQQQFHFPPEAKQFQSLEMFLIMSVVHECYMITGLYRKNTCSFQEFLNFSQNFIRKLTLQSLFLSRYTVFLKHHLNLSFILLKLWTQRFLHNTLVVIEKNPKKLPSGQNISAASNLLSSVNAHGVNSSFLFAKLLTQSLFVSSDQF